MSSFSPAKRSCGETSCARSACRNAETALSRAHGRRRSGSPRLEEFVEKNGQRRARAPFRKGMACIVYDLELQILALADQVELRTELVPALGQSHVERAEHEQGLDVAVEHFAHVTGRGGVSGGAEPPAQRLHRTLAGRPRGTHRPPIPRKDSPNVS